MVRRHKERKFGPGCEERWERERPLLQAEAERLLLPFDLTLANRPFLFDDDPVFSDFALFGVLGNLTYHQYNSLPASQRNLADWFEKMKAFQYGPKRKIELRSWNSGVGASATLAHSDRGRGTAATA